MVDKMDRFPEAFERFEKDVDIHNIRTFTQLFFEFQQWGGKRAVMTNKQVSALRKEAGARHIGDVESISFKRRGKTILHYRDLKSGRFISKQKYYETAE